MKRYVYSDTQTEQFNQRLADRFIKYCEDANLKNVGIYNVPDYGMRVIVGIPAPRVHAMVRSFRNALKRDGENIQFEVVSSPGEPNVIKNLCYVTK